MHTLQFLLLCPIAGLEIHLCKTQFEIDPFWRRTERNTLQFHPSTCLNENEENKQKTMTPRRCNAHPSCFANAYDSHSRVSICSFHKLCRYKGRQAGAKSRERTLRHLQFYLQLPPGLGELKGGTNNSFCSSWETQQCSRPGAR